MRILVIGGTKFIGPFVVRQPAEQKHEVTVFHRGQSKVDLPGSVRFVHGDRKQLYEFKAAFESSAPEVVLDMAPYTEPQAQAVVQTFKGLSQRVVAISCYDKILVERVFMSEPDLPATVLRLPWVYGPGDYLHRMFPYLKRMHDGRNFILLEEAQAGWRWTRGYVENVAAAIVQAITNERAIGQTYNLGEATAFTEAAWINEIGRAAKWQGKVVTLPKGKLPGHLSLNLDWHQHLVADTSRIRRELGYVEPVPIAEAIARTVRWQWENPPQQFDPKQFDYDAENAAQGA